MKGQRRRMIAIAIAFAVFLPACQVIRVNWGTLTRVDAPLNLRPDRRLSMVSPKAEDKVKLPMTVDWKVKGFEPTNGNHFGVYVDTAIPSPDDYARVRICTRLSELPPTPGDFRPICTDQRDRVRFTTNTKMRFDCFEPHFNRGKRRMNDHTVTVILLDKDFRRVGEAATEVMFRVDPTDAKKCRGFDQ